MKFLPLVLLLLLPTPLLALGSIGHEAVCAIAYRELTPTAKAAVDRLMSLEKNAKYKTFSRACSWADDKNGGRTKARNPDHYVNVPRNWRAIPEEECVLDKRCLFSALKEDEAILRSRANDRFKLKALKYFSHWVGDIHQPFHVSYEDDRGGNQVYLSKDSVCKKNLHAVWDRCIVNYIFTQMALNPRSVKSRQDFADRLHQQVTKTQKQNWVKNLQPLTWANESLTLVRAPSTKYCYLKGETCQYTQSSKYHIYRGKNKNSRQVKVRDSYLASIQDIKLERIQQAGIRLAAKLNEIFK